MPVRSDRLRVVDGISCFVQRGTVRQVADVIGELQVCVGIPLEGISRIFHSCLRLFLPATNGTQHRDHQPSAGDWKGALRDLSWYGLSLCLGRQAHAACGACGGSDGERHRTASTTQSHD